MTAEEELIHLRQENRLLRELTFLAEEQGLEWAAGLKALLLEMKEATDEASTFPGFGSPSVAN